MTNEYLDNIKNIFSNLDKWSNFPNYQLERRADIFFSIYLKEIIKDKINEEISLIIPEFPVRVGTINKEKSYLNLSYKIDYIAFCESNRKIYLIELKTDSGSLRDKQIEYLNKTKTAGISEIIEKSLLTIYDVTDKSYKSKYKAMFNDLKDIGILDNNFEYIESNYTFEILYILPEFDENTNKYLKKENVITREQTITFDDIIKSISHHQDDLTKRFIQSLVLWKNPPNYKPE